MKMSAGIDLEFDEGGARMRELGLWEPLLASILAEGPGLNLHYILGEGEAFLALIDPSWGVDGDQVPVIRVSGDPERVGVVVQNMLRIAEGQGWTSILVEDPFEDPEDTEWINQIEERVVR